MAKTRIPGAVQPGIKWGPFTLRIPFIHLRVAIPELLQGFAVAGATGLALVPLLTASFGLTFEEAVVMCMFHSLLISASWFFFGDPYAPGWLTPALPFVFAFVLGGGGTHAEQFQAMTALSLNFAAILIILGLTGLGAKLVDWVPNVLKGGIILGAAIAAFLRVFDLSDPSNALAQAPIAASAALALCMFLTFSKPFHAIAARFSPLQKLASYGLLPAFVVAGVVGFFTSEFDFVIRNGLLDVVGNATTLWEKSSPMVIGWPSLELMLKSMPLAIITYILFFGDLVTGDEMVNNARALRADEKIEIDNTRAHLSTGIRNVAMSVVAPFFGTQGILWTGVQVVILKRWVQGRDKMDSLYDGISSYYVLGIPLLFIVLPIVSLLQPLLPIALAVTLILTGFACATLSLSLVKDNTERGAMVLTAIALSLFEPWIGLLVGLATILLIVGPQVFVPESKPTASERMKDAGNESAKGPA